MRFGLADQVAEGFALQRQQVLFGHQGAAIHFAAAGIEAQIRSHSLLGNVIRYRVEARGVELLVDVLNRSEGSLIGKGQCIGLSIDANAIREVA